ncbi:MAG TPA: hypothetical protein VK324_17085, partial [Tepidisphaeraceae bacterium]|nr:hypothetical protein [Tepidisphaeraceae bacterium]
MDATPPPPSPMFLDVPALLDRSEPVAAGTMARYLLGGFVLAVMMGAMISSQGVAGRQVVDVLAPLVVFGLIVGTGILTIATASRVRADQRQLEAIEELVQLRRWDHAAMAVQELLSRPARSHGVRAQALIFLAAVLARYRRFEDAIAVQNHVLEHVPMDANTSHGVRLGRAMAMLHEDHLFDADRAIADLRRGGGRDSSAGLALVEIYRDVKTGHPQEAVELFESRLGQMRDKLGHRVADAYALAARAYD